MCRLCIPAVPPAYPVPALLTRARPWTAGTAETYSLRATVQTPHVRYGARTHGRALRRGKLENRFLQICMGFLFFFLFFVENFRIFVRIGCFNQRPDIRETMHSALNL